MNENSLYYTRKALTKGLYLNSIEKVTSPDIEKTEPIPQDLTLNLEYIFGMRADLAIIEMYKKMLKRTPAVHEVNSFVTAVKDGLSLPSIVYLISESKEFNSISDVYNIKLYKKIYRKNLIKQRLMRIPIINRLISLFTLSKQVEVLSLKVEQLNITLDENITKTNKQNDNIEYLTNLYEHHATVRKDSIVDTIKGVELRIENANKLLYKSIKYNKTHVHRLPRRVRAKL